MKKMIYGMVVCCALWAPHSIAVAVADLIIVRPSSKTTEEVVVAIKDYVEAKKWIYMGTNKVKPMQGEVTFVKVCIPEVGRIIWPLGLHLSAILPCGNIGVYQKQGKTEISMLHPGYMPILYPHPEIEKASAIATPLFSDMLEAVAK